MPMTPAEHHSATCPATPRGPWGCGHYAPVATPIPGTVPVLTVRDHGTWGASLTVPCADYDAYAALPAGLTFDGKVYTRTGWDSDRCYAVYAVGEEFARPVVNRDRDNRCPHK